MKGVLPRTTSSTGFARRSMQAIAMVLTACAAVALSTSTPLLAKELKTDPVSRVRAQDVFYTTSGAGTGLPNGAEIFAVEVSGNKTTARDIGPTHGEDCASLALSASGTLYSMCGPLFGDQRLATIDLKTGRANLFGVRVPSLAVMAMAFGPNGILYAVGGCNPDPNFECTPGSDPNYNSLYTVDTKTGAFRRVGPTGAPQLFMDLAFDRQGKMLGVTSTVNPSAIPAILYRIDPATGRATKITDLVGNTSIMGLAFGREGKLYATDNAQRPGLYVLDIATGFETPIAALPFGFSSGLELVNPGDDDNDDHCVSDRAEWPSWMRPNVPTVGVC